MLRNDCEHARRQSHVEESVVFFPSLLEFLQMFVELQKGVVAIVLAGNICADGAELLELLLAFLCWGLDVRLDAADVLLVVHFCSSISHDPDVLGQKLVAVL